MELLRRFLSRLHGNKTTTNNAGLVQSLQQTVFQIDLLGTLSYLSPSWFKLTGYDPQACLKTGFLGYVHPADRDRCRTYFERIMLRARETSHQASMRLICNDGRFCWVVIQANPVFDKHTNIRGIVGTLNDITQRMRSEDLRDARYRSLQNLINNLSGMVYRYRNDRHHTMEYISDGCRELLGYAPRDLINNRKLSYSSLIHTEDRQRVWDHVQEAIQQNRPFTVTYRLHTTDGLRWVREWGRGMVSDSGVLLCVEGFIADMTEHEDQPQPTPQHTQAATRLGG